MLARESKRETLPQQRGKKKGKASIGRTVVPELETGTEDQSKALLSELINGSRARVQTDLLLTPKAVGYSLQSLVPAKMQDVPQRPAGLSTGMGVGGSSIWERRCRDG